MTPKAHFKFRRAMSLCPYVRGETLLLPGRNLNLNRNPTKLRRNPLPIYHLCPECQRNASKRQTHPLQYQDHEVLEFRGTFTAFISDLASVSHYVHVRVVNPSKYFAAIPMHLYSGRPPVLLWTAAGDSRC